MPLLDFQVIWPLMEQLLAHGAKPNQADDWRKRLVALLSAETAARVSRLHFEVFVLRALARKRELWAAASLRLGHWLDDGEFSDFCGWLMAHGEAAWNRVLADSDALVDLKVRTDRKGQAQAALPALNVTPGKIYQKLVANDDVLDQRLRAEHASWCAAAGCDDTAIGWAYWSLPDATELATRFPRLWTLCADAWSADQPNPFACFRQEVELAGLGRVKLGDTLISRHDGRAFTVEGLSLPFAMLSEYEGDTDPEAEADVAVDSMVVARVRHADGTVACNQGLSRQFQRWPHEPAVGSLVGDPPAGWDANDEADSNADAEQAAWEARVEAIQARVAAHIDGEVRVQYAAAPDGSDGLPRDNLDEVAIEGAVRFVEVDPQDGERFESEVLHSPTWLQVAVLANRMMCQLHYDHHVYLEDIEIVRRPKGKPKELAFVLGS